MLKNQQSSQPTLLSRRPCEGGGTGIAKLQVLPNSPSVYRGGAHRAGALQAQRVEDLGGALTKLLDYRDADGRYLVTRKVHWQAVYRVLVDEGWYDASLGYAGFVDYIRSVAPPGGFRIMPDVETIRHISQTLYARPFRDWRYDAAYGTKRWAYERMRAVAEVSQSCLGKKDRGKVGGVDKL